MDRIKRKIAEERERGEKVFSHGNYLTPTEDAIACDLVDAITQGNYD